MRHTSHNKRSLRAHQAFRRSAGFTLIELLVSVGIFSVIGLGMTTYITDTFRRVGTESKAASASNELRNALQLLSSELRMSRGISPYMSGTNSALGNCAGSISATSTTLKFFSVQDSSSSPSGVVPYYIGYSYDAASKKLYRGQVQAPSLTSCTLPAVDPTSVAARQILAENVIQIDGNNDGSIDPIFAYTSPKVVFNAGAEAIGAGGVTVTQKFTNSITTRG